MPSLTRALRAAALLLAMAAGLHGPVHAQPYTETFGDIATLPGAGWAMSNQSSPPGTTGWSQGDSSMFSAYSGAATAYIAADLNNTVFTGTISNWLLTPVRTLRNGDVLTFYTRSSDTRPDRLEVRMSTNGASTNVGPPNEGDFKALLLEINHYLDPNVYPTTWTQYTITLSGLSAPTSGRFAFRYFVTNGGPSGSNSDYIGIDDVVYTPYICPPITVTGTPASGAAGEAYAYSMGQTGALGSANFAITAGALPPGVTMSSAGVISGTPTATGTFNFTVTASDNSACSGAHSHSITVLAGKPPQPGNATATAGDTTALVGWDEVWIDPYWIPISSYTATAVEDPTKSCTLSTGTGSSCTVSGLTNGTSYTFRVVAHNASAAQISDPAITNAVTPQGPQSITFTPDPIPPQHLGTTLTLGAPGQPVATATSGLPVAYAATGNCSIAGSVVSFSGAGSCTLTASQPGGGAFAAAADVARTFAVQAAAAPAAIPTLSQWGLALLSALAALTALGALPGLRRMQDKPAPGA
ncbi:IPTL-CTERM sorting domain-containing protein [Xylophilus sp. ASV27]|uniref:IPTL-CTERM sorting domain-containing protein n=1 Tax=Xylophilus sp. ASV27 TaxID=2795129 RepID=UPI0018EB46A9|nr:IPTL-CTERM sorting domain-containing protein [Xylophilus sp. ASV27]